MGKQEELENKIEILDALAKAEHFMVLVQSEETHKEKNLDTASE